MTPEQRQRIADVCEQAARLRPEEREGFVESQCQGNDELLNEVISALPGYLLRAGMDAGRAGTTSAILTAIPEIPAPGLKIGRYEITGTIGSGGSGQVYSALDRTVGRVVAIKVLNAPGNPDLVKRFQAEAKTVANLHHKNIVTVHEYGEENGVPYLVMEYLDGTTLQELISRGSLSLLEKVEIMTEVAEGLQYAHECGITHRDIKPANIMQLTDGSVKIMDFGIARWGPETAARLTQTGLLIGSIMYMAPEQFSGTADALTDVFSYGVTFYELLTGINPFTADDPVAIIFKIANSDPPAAHKLAPECPPTLEAVITHLLARDREGRYTSLADVLADTSAILSGLRHDEARRCLSDAGQMFAAGKLDAARASVRKALRLDPARDDVRKLRTEIDEAIRRRDTAIRFEHLLEQAESAVTERKFEEAGALLDSIRELGVMNPAMDERLGVVAAWVEVSRRSERALYEAERNLRSGNRTKAFLAVSRVLSEDPQNGSAQALLAEIQQQIAAEGARFREEISGIESLIQEGQGEAALAKIDRLVRENPDPESLENQQLVALRQRASAAPAGKGREREVAEIVARAEGLIACQEYLPAIVVLEEAIARLGDDWDLSRLLLQATVARNAQAEPMQARPPASPGEPVPEIAPDSPEVEQWRQAIGKLDQFLVPADAPPATPLLTTASFSTTQAFIAPQAPEAPTLALPAAEPLPPEPTIQLPKPQETVRETPPPLQPRRQLTPVWIALAGFAAFLVLLILLVPLGLRLLNARHPGGNSGGATLSIDDVTASLTAVRGNPYQLDLRASGGSPPISWNVLDGSLPGGLSLNSETGRIAGVPATTGMYSFVVTARNPARQSAQRPLTIEVVDPPESTSTAPAVEPPATGTAAGNPPPCKAAAFNMDQYGDLLSGELTWTGTLPAGGTLEIRNRRASMGVVRGDIFPKGVPIRIFVTPAPVRIAALPSAANCWDPKLVLENMGEARSEIKVQWEVFQP